jgi:hypothetical protein
LYWLFKFISFIPKTWVKINSSKEKKTPAEGTS